MIRDPSDGSVREHHPKPLEAFTNAPESDGLSTGLPPESKKPKDIAKLERSREWLQNYKSQKGQ